MNKKQSNELTFTAAMDRKDKTKKTYDGGFHVQAAPKRAKCNASKRSSTQGFTCK